MAATVDLSMVTSSAQVFTSPQNTLPQIRAIHKALHGQIDDRAARLRTQVGTSYRDLLGTADAIVRMRSDMDAIQHALGSMGGRCGRAVVGAKAAGWDRFVAHTGEFAPADDAMALLASKGRQLSVVARTRLLDACALATRRVLTAGLESAGGGKRGDRLLVAAKLLLLSRLVASSLGDVDGATVEPGPDARARATMDATRKSLERSLERSFTKMLESSGDEVDRDDVLKALCAYSLATNLGAREALRRFLAIRGRAMAAAFEASEEREGEPGRDHRRGAADVLSCLGLYTCTLLDVQAIVPGRLAEALAGLKRHGLLEDESLLRLEGLRLDVHARWCGDEIRYYKPYMRHDDLDGPQAREMLATWAATGGDLLLRGLGKSLERLHEFRAIVELRTSVLHGWIRDGGRVRGLDPAEMLNRLREVINAHLLSTLVSKVQKLRLVSSELGATLETWQAGRKTADHRRRDLWEDGDDVGEDGMDGVDDDEEEDNYDAGRSHGRGLDTDLFLATGATHLTNEVVSRLHGRSNAVARAVTSYQSWHRVVGDVGDVIDQLRRQKWANDVDEIEDEETIEHRQRLLSRDDPQALQDRLNQALANAFAELDTHLSRLWVAAASERKDERDGNVAGPAAMYIIRVLRDVRNQLPDSVEAARGLGMVLIPTLHERIIETVVASPLDEFASYAIARRSVAGRGLWEGTEPELPTAPSPGVFTFLRAIVTSMADAGMDLWSPTAVAALKARVRRRLGGSWLVALEAHLKTEEPSPAAAAEVIQEDAGRVAAAAGATKPAAAVDSATEDGGGDEEGVHDPKSDSDNDGTAGDQEPVSHSSPKPSAPLASLVTPEQRRDLLIQWLFDIYLFQCCLGPPAVPAEDELRGLEEQIYKRTGVESALVRQRLVKSSQDYWKRTGLLFGLLA